MCRSARSFMSMTRFQRTVVGSRWSVAEVEPVVDRRGQQVVGGGDRVEVAGELEVDRVRRLELARPAAGRPPLRPKTGPIDGCRKRQDRDSLADPPQALGQADRRRRLPLAGRRRRDRRDQDQLARASRPAAATASSRTLALSRPYGSRCSGGDLQVARPPRRSAGARLLRCVTFASESSTQVGGLRPRCPSLSGSNH